MRIRTLTLLTAVLVLGIASTGSRSVRADDFRVSSSQRMDAILQQQEQDIGQLRTELASLRRELSEAVRSPEGTVGSNPQGGNSAGGAATCCNSISCCNSAGCCNSTCCDPCCKPEPLAYQAGFGWFGYGEALIVKPYSTYGTATQGDFNWTATPRIVLGRVGDSGFGIRARYWTFNDFADTNSVFFGGLFRNQIQTHVADIEVLDRIRLGKWIVTGSLGLRYVSYLNRFTDTIGAVGAPGALIARSRIEGMGIVGGLGFVRPFTYRWSFYGNARYSVIAGKTSIDVIALPANLHSTTESITELGGGIQYNRTMWNGMNLLARGGYEAQYWNGFGDIGAFGLGQSTAFAGLTFGAGIAF